MAINADGAYDSRDGYGIRDEDGNILVYLATVNGSPVGTPAPVNSWVFRQDTLTVWYKFGAGDNDWRQLQAQDITYDPGILPNFLGTEENVNDALNTLGNQTFADAVNFQDFESNAQQNTTSNGWVTKATFTTENLPSGRYIIFLATQAGQSDKEKQFGVRVQARDGTSGGWTTQQPLDLLDTVGSDETFKLISGFAFFERTGDDIPFQIRIQFGQTNDGGTARIRESKVLTFKVDDV